MDYLNEIEKQEVQKFLENTVLKEAVKKVILAGIYFNGTLRPGEKADPLRNFALSLVSSAIANGTRNEQIGEDVRAKLIGVGLLEDAYQALEKLKKVEVRETKKVNPAR